MNDIIKVTEVYGLREGRRLPYACPYMRANISYAIITSNYGHINLSMMGAVYGVLRVAAENGLCVCSAMLWCMSDH